MASAQDIEILFATGIGEIEKQIKYYENRKEIARWASYLFRCIAAFSFVIGTLVPLLVPLKWPTQDSSTLLAVGYIFLAASGISIVLDQFFLGSRSWTRYTLSYLKLGHIRDALQFEKSIFPLLDPGDPVALDKLTAALGKISQIRFQQQKIVEDETIAWDTQFNEAISAFSKRLDTAALEAKNSLTSLKFGGIEISLSASKQEDIESASIAIGSRDFVDLSPPYTRKMGFQAVEPGVTKISVRWKKKGLSEQYSDENLVTVKSGEIVKFSVSLD